MSLFLAEVVRSNFFYQLYTFYYCTINTPPITNTTTTTATTVTAYNDDHYEIPVQLKRLNNTIISDSCFYHPSAHQNV